ncbi:ARM repeat-containing protein [Metschnikowia bicuspidata]|uniref:ARM repeat-containing protein n=1 Tax=Metschnikowia bicuspidata TaxID=27322 RepID=A0A4P9ZH19_9ASCO|nr:ARM repeat-containing protein [Metschnikowia bicuspidata]
MDASANANAYHRCQNDQFIAANSRVNVHRKNHNANRRKAEMATKYANATLDDFANDICSICKDQHGCRFLQRHLDLGSDASVSGDTRTDDVATVVFNAIHTQIVELMVDPFGNYLVQKLFEKVTAPQRLVLVRTAAPEFIRIALDAHGTRALQKLVEQVLMPEEVRHIVESLAPHVVALSRDLNGNHVVQKCLQRLRPEHNQFVFDAAAASCKEIAMHRHGCCVLQRCLDHGNDAQRQQLSLRVAENATSLSLDPYGNYVVQYVLARGDECSIGIILDHIRANIVALSVHKFGSNVIEKTLRTRKWSELVIELLLANGAQLLVLLNDAYGNYVLQTALDVANATNLSKLAYSLQPLLPGVKNTPHGRRIFTKIQHIL